MILVETIIEGVEDQRESGVWIFIRYPCSLFSRQALVQSLKESTNLVYVATYAGQNYGGFAEVQRGASCRFLFIQFTVLCYISREALCKKIKLKALVHVETKPHIDEPPGTP